MLFILIYKFCVIKTTINFEKSFSCSKIIHFLFLNNSTFSVYLLNCFLTAGTVWVRSISKTIFFFISFPNVPPHTKLSPTLGQKGIFAATIGKFVLARKNCELWARGGDSVLHLFRIYIQSACCTIEKPPVIVIQPAVQKRWTALPGHSCISMHFFRGFRIENVIRTNSLHICT